MDDLEDKTDADAAATTEGATIDGAAADADAGGKAIQSGAADLSKMQSERDKETARANKLQKELDSAKLATAKDVVGSEVPLQVQEWILAAKNRTRQVLFDSNPKFAAYAVSPALIIGDTPVEMEASAKSLAEFVDKLEGSVRDSVLRDHGFNPEPLASVRAAGKSFASMNSAEFNALVDEALRG